MEQLQQFVMKARIGDVAFAVAKPEELTVELGQTAGIRAVEDHLPQRNDHWCHVSNAAPWRVASP